MALPGSVGFISQSGALTTAILDWSLRARVGFSAFISIGSMLDVGWGDLIDYLGDDPRTRSIVIYMESVGDARAFLSARPARSPWPSRSSSSRPAEPRPPRRPPPRTPGRSPAPTRSSTPPSVARGRAPGEHDLRRLLPRRDPRQAAPAQGSPKLSIVTNAGGPGVLAVDALIG